MRAPARRAALWFSLAIGICLASAAWAAAAAPPPLSETAPVEEQPNGDEKAESSHALAILTLMLLLGVALTVGQFLERNNINWMSEAGGALIVGIVLGLVVTLANNVSHWYSDFFKFDTQYFFLFLLPPIIFDAGFNLDVKPFFDNMGGIAMLAFVGTGVSTMVISSMMWLLGVMGLSYRIPFYHASLFGAIISATDPVTVLAVFGRLQANANLNALVFGESVLNDAVAIVLYTVIEDIGGASGSPSTLGSLLKAAWSFFYIFAGSLVIGVAFALVAALLFRSGYLKSEHSPVEASLVIILAYCSFYLADGLDLSGITSIMFCGIVMAKYCRPNLSPKTNERVGAFFRVIAYLAEIFVFIYIGVALFTEPQARKIGRTWPFIMFSLVALAISRAANVYPITAICNVLTPAEGRRIPQTHKHMLWFSGLRGAMAFALANLAQESLSKRSEAIPGSTDADAGDVILTATFFMVLITVLVNGGGTYYLLKFWNLQAAPGGDDPRAAMELAPMLSSRWSHGSPSAVLTTEHNLHHPGSPTVTCATGLAAPTVQPRGLIKSIHDYQRQGGLTKQFEQIDRAVTDYFVTGNEGALSSQHSLNATADNGFANEAVADNGNAAAAPAQPPADVPDEQQ